MTSPDIPPVRPGSVSQPDTSVNDRIAALEALVRELQAKNMDNATVGQGGTFRGFYDNGQLSFTLGRDKADGVRKAKFYWPSTGKEAFQIGPGNQTIDPPEQEQWRLNDQQGKRMYATDGIAGYGLAEPGLTYMLTQRFNGIANATNTAGTEYEVATADAIFYNPAVLVQVLCTASVAYTIRVAAFIDGDQVVTSSTDSYAAGGARYVTKIVLLPAEAMNRQNVKIKVLLTPGTTASTPVWPTICHGKSKSYYDISAQWY